MLAVGVVLLAGGYGAQHTSSGINCSSRTLMSLPVTSKLRPTHCSACSIAEYNRNGKKGHSHVLAVGYVIAVVVG